MKRLKGVQPLSARIVPNNNISLQRQKISELHGSRPWVYKT